MEYFFNPTGIAVIGASANKAKGGYCILRNLIKGFGGGIYPVNPAYSEIDNLPCYPSVLDVPDPVDLAIVFVPAPMVPRVLRECAERGIKGAMIQSGGFAESGDRGKGLQDRIIEIGSETGIRIWGPNCMGLVDAVRDQVFSFVFPSIWQNGLLAGGVSLVVQSGMLSAGFLIDIISNGTMGISKVCSIGNKADINESDMLSYLIDDSNTGVIGLYLESIPDGRRFIDLCRGSEKPIVVLRGGKSRKGAEAALSHTASLAGNGAVIDGALAQVGVIEAYDFKQMMDLCRSLAEYHEIKAKKNRRVAILTMSGAAGIVSADFIEEQGLSVAALSETAVDELRQIFPEWMPVSNPVDLWPAIELHGRDKAYQSAFQAVFGDPNVDAVLFHRFVGGAASGMDMADLAARARKSAKPLFGWLFGDRDEAYQFHMSAREEGIPVFSELSRAVECMGAVLTRQLPADYHSKTKSINESPAIKKKLTGVLTNASGVLDEYQSKQILSRCGIPVVNEQRISDTAGLNRAAAEYGFPIVLKGLLPGEIHKTESGLVRTNLMSAEDAQTIFLEFMNRLSKKGKGSILVQRQIQGYPELIAGMIRDPQFGPCVMCGFGGILAEVIKDSVFAVAPLSRSEARDLIDRLKTQKLLDGFRGNIAVDRDALADILVRLGELGTAFEQIKEIDINPLIVHDGVPVAVDATIIMDA